MLGPNQLFHIDEKYAIVGPQHARKLNTIRITSTRDDIVDPARPDEFFEKSVLEYEFMVVGFKACFYHRFLQKNLFVFLGLKHF